MKPRKEPLDTQAILEKLCPDGVIAQKLPYYEARDAQLELMKLIIRSFNENTLAAAEAGTGVGKSFAYLLPALEFAAATGERVLISTATITLQEQLFEKDVPLVNSALETSLKTVLVKGRGNFLCYRRLEAVHTEYTSEFDLDDKNTIKKIDAWAKTTPTGSRSDVPFAFSENIWSRIASDADTCMGMRCIHYEACFVMKQRREAAEAHILIVNHHLLFADLAARAEGAGYETTAVLPPYQRIILDEAHTIEDAATSFFSSEFSRHTINLMLGRLFRQRGALKSGLLLRLLAFAGGSDLTNEWNTAMDAIRDTAAKLDTAALELCGTESAFRLVAAREDLITERLTPYFLALKASIIRFTGGILDMINEVEKKEGLHKDDKNDQDSENSKDQRTTDIEIMLREVSSATRRLIAVADLSDAFTTFKAYQDDVFWVERRIPRRYASAQDWAVFTRAPLDISLRLKTALFEKHRTVIALSATLTVADRFDFWAKRAGIGLAEDEFGEKRHVLTGNFPSPFPYNRVVLLGAAEDAPLPGDARFRDFINTAVLRLVEASGGSALVLFTSFESLDSAWAFAAPHLEKQGIHCLKHGNDDRSRLLRAFLNEETSVLFATDSFWEGIDAPGNTLRLVILCRLPFKSPNEPVFEARAEAMEQRGGNPFMELSVPEAVIKFRQGFGRLMRRSSDHGVVAVLDSRILKKRYGELFLRSLPPTKTLFGSFDALLRTTENFLCC
ncbi:MAG: ATP-dependent DNA helicase DinG [Spirochaetaceae bacterium]|nr:ATP-dependent DNA helicase DinG [Spirochaetaceae bacterium]